MRTEVWFGPKGTLTTVWAAWGSKPTAARRTEYDDLWVIAAACPATGEAARIIMPDLDTETINTFLGEFSRQLAPDVPAVLIWDNASFHTHEPVAEGADKRDADRAAALLGGVESDREPVALPAVPRLVEPVL